MPLREMHVQEATRPAIDQWWSEKDAELQTCATEGDMRGFHNGLKSAWKEL